MVYHYRGDDSVSGRWTGNTFADLSAQQIDENTYTSAKGIADLIAALTTTVSIDFISIAGNDLTFHMTDATLQGPFSIPISVFLDRGAWAPLTSYAVNDTFTINGTLYLVIFAHTSAATFSAGANDGLGHDFYSPMLSVPGSALPTGGATGMNLRKSSGTDFATAWGFDDASETTFTPSTASGLTSTNVADALEEIEANISGAGVALSSLSDVNITEGAGIDGYVLTWNSASSKWVAGLTPNNLAGMADVNVTEGSGINGFFLKWDNATSKWIAAASSSALSGLSDVNVSEGSGINGYFLKWDNGTSKWIASTVPLSGLSDVNVTEGSGINGYFLKWDNATSKWVASLSGATAVALSGLTDVNVSEGSGINGYFLKWDNGTSKWIAALGLLAANNLSDVASASTARTNLGLGTIATFPETTTAQYLANTSGKALSTDKVWAAADYVALTDAATVALDMALFINATVTLGGNRTLGNPSNTKNGQTGVIEIKQDGTGTRTLAYSSNWKFAGGTAPVLTTTASARDLLFYQVISSTVIYGTLVKDVK